MGTMLVNGWPLAALVVVAIACVLFCLYSPMRKGKGEKPRPAGTARWETENIVSAQMYDVETDQVLFLIFATAFGKRWAVEQAGVRGPDFRSREAAVKYCNRLAERDGYAVETE